ncbi:response regulator transcription factor [Nocardia tengchongensis]|uniref:response regulator transcription factor n=1 Tax=Nocardia tengchongensis TaxID=2055889 RepID=UPI003618DC89
MNLHQLSTIRAGRPLIGVRDSAHPAARVLVVEQHAATAEMEQLVLAAAGYDALHVSTATQALTTIGSWKPDLVLMDLILPDLSGPEFCLRLRATSSVPILIVSTETDPDLVGLAIDAGASGYLPKPFRTVELLDRIHTGLGF